MENKLFLTLISFIVLCFIAFPARSYEIENTHPFLTKQIVLLYNQLYSPKISDEELEKLLKGSADEDTDPRWINHFYDPNTGQGWLGQKLGDVPAEAVMQVSDISFGKEPVPVINWIHNQQLQAEEYGLYQGDRTFENAVLFYAENNKKESFYTLGHILHDFEDMAVPAHTRQDSHFDMPVPEIIQNYLGINLDKGEPYEKWVETAKENFNADFSGALKSNYTPPCSSLDECVKTLALYSNEGFFSSDTITDEDYGLPEISSYKDIPENGKIFRYYFDKENNLLFRADVDGFLDVAANPTVDLKEIHESYWQRLAPRAIKAGAEIIKYFFEQADKLEKGEISIKRPVPPTLFVEIKNFSPYGQITKVYKIGRNSLADLWGKVKNFGSDFKSHLAGTFNDIKFNSFTTSMLPGLSVEESPEEDSALLSKQINEKLDELFAQGPAEDYEGKGGPDPQLLSEDEKQDILDDIAENIDVIAEQIRQMLTIRDELEEPPLTPDETQNHNNESKGGGGNTSKVYDKILISEVQTKGNTDEKEEFVELYNPNSKEIDLSDWYLQKKTKTGDDYSTYASSNLFSGKKISPKGYFLVARENYFRSAGDIFTDASLSDDNSLVLKNPNRDVSDKVGWGLAQDFELCPAENHDKGQSIGRKTADEIVLDTDNNFSDFEIQTPTPKNKNSPYSIPPIIQNDKTPPQVEFKLSQIQENTSFEFNFIITDPLDFATPSGLAGYVLRWKNSQEGVWHEEAPSDVLGSPVSKDISWSFSGNDETIYYFQAKAKDVAGNESEWLPETPAETKVSIFKKIVVNEVQTEGLTVKDEFIELYNPNNINIDLSGFALKKKTSGGTESNLVSSSNFSGTILANDYFLIVPQKNDDGTKNYTGEAEADLYYSGKTYSIANDNTILLYDSKNRLLDKVGFGGASDFEALAAKNPEESKSIERKKAGLDTDNNSSDFRSSDASTPKSSSPKVILQDATNYATCMSSSYPGTLNYNLALKWSSPSAITSYQVQYKLNNGEWTDWLASTPLTQGTFKSAYSLLRDKIYYFRARGQDLEGNVGNWAQIKVDLSNPVVINEVALYGTNASRSDGWIELYNKSDKDIDLTGWEVWSDVQEMGAFLEGIIPAKGYYILEKGDEGTLSLLANKIFSALPVGYIYLRDKNKRYVDELSTPSGGWQENNFLFDGNYYSLERVSPFSLGINSKNWIKNNGTVKNGIDRASNAVYGTPGSQNSVYQLYTAYSVSFVEDELLPKSLSPYLFSNNVFVFENSTLTIEPGSVIKFYDTSSALTVKGTLKAKGTDTEKIIFTSYIDDDHGGDSNYDSGTSLPVAGSWIGLRFRDSSLNSELENAEFYYGGASTGIAPLIFGSTLQAHFCPVFIKNCLFNANKNQGIMLVNSPSVIENSQFWNFTSADEGLKGIGLHIRGGSPEVKKCHFQTNDYGIYVDSWPDTETGETYPASPNLHLYDPFDPDKNTFMDSNVADILDVSGP